MEPSDSGIYSPSHQSTVSVWIDEFSTGIVRDGNKDDWFSRGFTGRYINMTLASIPPEVEQLINNHGFAVAEGAYSNRPAIIGRTLPRYSILALVTRGKDEKGRSFGCHRYFLCEGSDNLGKILEWIEDYRNQHGSYPVFNPFDEEWEKPQKRFTVIVPDSRTHFVNKASRLYEKLPIVPWDENIDVTEINQLAEQKAATVSERRSIVSWAFDVEALENPEQFQVIKPASKKAESLLSSIVQASTTRDTPSLLSSKATRSLPSVTYSGGLNEQEIKVTIKHLIGSNQINTGFFQTFIEILIKVEEEFEDSSQASNFLNKFFDDEGVPDALNLGIKSSQMVRLLTLRAIAIPETLDKCLDWIQLGKEKNDESQNTFVEFQSNLKLPLKQSQLQENQVKKLQSNLFRGVENVLAKLYKRQVSIETTLWLLSSSESIWSIVKNILREVIRHDLKVVGDRYRDRAQATVKKTQQICTDKDPINPGDCNSTNPQPQEECLLNGQEFERIWGEMQRYWGTSPRSYNKQFLPLSELFYKLNYSLEAACFYKVGRGLVPPNVYQEAKQDEPDFNQGRPFNLKLYKELTRLQKLKKITLWVTRKMLLPGALIFLLVAVSVELFRSLNWILITLRDRGQRDRGQVTSQENTPQISQPPPESSPQEKPSNLPSQSLYVKEFDIKAIKDAEIQRKGRESLQNGKTGQALREVVQNLLNNSRKRNSLLDKGIPGDQIEKTVINQLKDTLAGRPLTDEQRKQLNYAGIVEGSLQKDQDDKWIAAIYSYQRYKGTNGLCGCMEVDDETARNLQRDIYGFLSSPQYQSTAPSDPSSPALNFPSSGSQSFSPDGKRDERYPANP